MKIRKPGFGHTRFLRAGTAMGRVLIMREEPGDGEPGAGDEVARLKAKNAKLADEDKKMRARLKALEDAAADAKAKEDAAETEKQRAAGDFAKIEQGYKDRLAAAEKATADINARFQGVMVDQALGSALDAAGVENPVFRKAALSLIKSGNKFDITDDNTVSVGGTQLTDFIKTWAGSEEGKSFVKNGNGGGGAPQTTQKPGGGANNVTGNMGGKPEERTAAIATRFPELNNNQ